MKERNNWENERMNEFCYCEGIKCWRGNENTKKNTQKRIVDLFCNLSYNYVW